MTSQAFCVRARRRADIEAQLLIGGVEPNPGPRRNNRNNRHRQSNNRNYAPSNYEDNAYDYEEETETSEEDYESNATEEHVLSSQQWWNVAPTPAAVPDPESEATSNSNGNGRGRRGRRKGKNADARYRNGAATRYPRAALREMEYDDDGRPVWCTCAQRQLEMFNEMVEYPRYNRDEINFEVWLAEMFGDFMTSCAAEVRRISLMKEELVVWTLRAALMADAYDISMFHISFCPVGRCREFRESPELMEAHVLAEHPSSKEAKAIRRGEYWNHSTRDAGESQSSTSVESEPIPQRRSVAAPSAYARPTAAPSTAPRLADARPIDTRLISARPVAATTVAATSMSATPMSGTSTAATPTAATTSDATSADATPAQIAEFLELENQLKAQCATLEGFKVKMQRLQAATTNGLQVAHYQERFAMLTQMWNYLLRERSELFLESTLAAKNHKPQASVAEVLRQVRKILNEQEVMIDEFRESVYNL